MSTNSFDARAELAVGERRLEIFRLDALQPRFDVARLPFSLKVLLENLLRTEGGGVGHAATTSRRSPAGTPRPSRADGDRLHARRACCCRTSPACPPSSTSPRCATRWRRWAATRRRSTRWSRPSWSSTTRSRSTCSAPATPSGATPSGSSSATRSATRSCAGARRRSTTSRVVPPDTGIVHQVNLEYLARVVFVDERRRGLAYPDTLVGTDSHTTMVNGLGVLGWGVGGIEAEAAMLGQPMSMLIPQVVGFELHGELPRGRDRDRPRADRHRDAARARASSGSSSSSTAPAWRSCRSPTGRRSATCRPSSARPARSSRSTPRRCATCELTGRPAEQIALVEAYAREQGMWHDADSAAAGLLRHARARPGERRAVAGRPQAPAGPRVADRRAEGVPRGARGARPGLRLLRRGLGGELPVQRPAGEQRARARPGPGASDHSPSSRDRVAERWRSAGRRRAATAAPVVLADGTRDDARPRPRGDRRDHELHEHLEPVGDDRRRAAGAQRGGARADAPSRGSRRPSRRARRW